MLNGLNYNQAQTACFNTSLAVAVDTDSAGHQAHGLQPIPRSPASSPAGYLIASKSPFVATSCVDKSAQWRSYLE